MRNCFRFSTLVNNNVNIIEMGNANINKKGKIKGENAVR
jgi:hypothetical protein